MSKFFSDKSIAIFPKEYIDSVNVSFLFKIDFERVEKANLIISGESEYQIFLNGKLIHYGPARAAHNYHRVDKIKLTHIEDKNRLVIILASYRAHTFDRINVPPFLRFELKTPDSVIALSDLNTEAFLYESRYQKVVRFSYQRAFSESYNEMFTNDVFFYGNAVKLPKAEVMQNEYGQYLKRHVSYPKLKNVKALLKEKDNVVIDKNKKIYKDRHMFNEGMIIFPIKDWEKNPNDTVSQLSHNRLNEINNHLYDYQSLAYVLPHSETGFIRTKIKVYKPCDLYIYFDEMSSDKNTINFNFYRNRTHNIVTYELKEGEYDLISFQPYTAKYIRVTNLKGEVEIKDVSLIILENPDSYKLKYQFNDKKLKAIFKSARRTFASNAVDILTDCPSRERAGWLCDGYFTGRAEKLFTGKNLVERNFLENYSHYRYHGDMEKDMVPMCYPADFFNNEMYIPNWGMFYVVELASYLSRNKDEKLRKESIENIKGLIRFFEKYENEYGLLEDLENWIMIDWSHANDPESICGVNIPSNALYAAFLESASVILRKDSLSKKAENVKKQIKNRAFDGKFFVDNLIRDDKKNLIRNNRICETTFYYLFYFKVITKEEYPDVFNTMVNDFGPNRNIEKVYPNIYKSNVFIGDYLRLEILLRYGLSSKVLSETVDYFYKMAKTTGTLWEHDSLHGSLNHGFASYIANVIFKALTGVYHINYINKIIYKRNGVKGMTYKFELPLEKGKITFSDKGINLIDGYKIMMEE